MLPSPYMFSLLATVFSLVILSSPFWGDEESSNHVMRLIGENYAGWQERVHVVSQALAK